MSEGPEDSGDTQDSSSFVVSLASAPDEGDCEELAFERVLLSHEQRAPSERYGHTAVLLGRSVYVFGGCSAAGRFLGDLWRFDVERRVWEQLEARGDQWPPGRHFHCSAVYKEWVYALFGKSNGYMNDVWRFSSETLLWERVQATTSQQDEVVGPSRRYGHSVVRYKGRLVLFGGFDDFGLECNDLWYYEFDDNRWTQVEYTLGDAPDSVHHSAVVYQGSMFVWGGRGGSSHLYEYRFGTKTWSPVMVRQGSAPPAVWGHRACVFEDRMYVFGGGDHVMCSSAVYMFSFETYEWRRMGSMPFSSRYFMSMTQEGNRLYFFGGKNIHSYSFDECYLFELPVTRVIPPDTFVVDFQAILQDVDTCDLHFSFPSGPPLHGHRNIMYARIPRLRSMCGPDGVLQVTQYSQRVFSAFLQFVYTNVLPVETLGTEHLFQMLQLAAEFESPYLQLRVEGTIVERAEVSTIISFLARCIELREQRGMCLPKLSNFCVRLIVSNFGGLRYQAKAGLPYACYRDLKALAEDEG